MSRWSLSSAAPASHSTPDAALQTTSRSNTSRSRWRRFRSDAAAALRPTCSAT
jgi:hypothetical protein